jgi:hypothetical protein
LNSSREVESQACSEALSLYAKGYPKMMPGFDVVEVSSETVPMMEGVTLTHA